MGYMGEGHIGDGGTAWGIGGGPEEGGQFCHVHVLWSKKIGNPV